MSTFNYQYNNNNGMYSENGNYSSSMSGGGDSSYWNNQQNNNEYYNGQTQPQQQDYSNNNIWNQYQQQQQQQQQNTTQPSYSQIASQGGAWGNNINNYNTNNTNNNAWNQPLQQQQLQQPPQQQFYSNPTPTQGSSLIIPPPVFKKKSKKEATQPVNVFNSKQQASSSPSPSQTQTFKTQPITSITESKLKTQPTAAATHQQKPKQDKSKKKELAAYVERAFKSASNQEELVQIQKIIKEKITDYQTKGFINSIDWNNEPLPKLAKDEKVWEQDIVPINSNVKKRKKEYKEPESETMKRFARFGNNSNNNNNNNNSSTVGNYNNNSFYNKDYNYSGYNINNSNSNNNNNDGELDWDSLTIKGTSTKLEKPYLRLTTAPDPATVRPEETLKKTLVFLKKKWMETEDYTYICEQFRSIRQDLTVQRIKNRFTVEVYETHARLALENNDLGQFNQCQTQLFQLYKTGQTSNSEGEFFAYRLLYNIYQENSNDLTKTMSELTKELASLNGVQHALKVRTAIYTNNYCAYFRLLKQCPNMAQYLMDKITPRIRIQALQTIMKAYRPTVQLSQLIELGFKTEKDCKDYLDQNKLVWSNPHQKKEIDSKLSLSIVNQLEIQHYL